MLSKRIEMRVRIVSVWAAGVGLFLASMPVVAHHSVAAEFDVNQPVTLKGAVTKVEWMNPHVWIYLDVTGENGEVTHWQCEGGAPNGLTRLGWSRDSLKVGDQVIVQGFRAKNGASTANARQVTLPNGRKIFNGSAEDGGPGKKDSSQ